MSEPLENVFDFKEIGRTPQTSPPHFVTSVWTGLSSKSMPLQFRTIRHLGAGAWGSVDEIKFSKANRSTARKKYDFASKQDLEHRVRAEVEIMKQVRHRRIVNLLGTFTVGSTFSLLMDPVAECNLKQLMHLSPQDNKLAQSTISLWTWELASAVKYLHSPPVSIIHRDLKPANILVYDSHIRITDFGSATFCKEDSDVSKPDHVTKVYAPPETFNNSGWGRAADIFSLGCVLVEMTTIILGFSLDSFEEARSSRIDRGGKRDSSFYNHLPDVANWIKKLRARSKHRFISRILDWCGEMLSSEPEDRPSASAIADNIAHSSCSTCSQNRYQDCDEEESQCCPKCTSAALPRPFAPFLYPKISRPDYMLEKFHQDHDSMEQLLATGSNERDSHLRYLKAVIERAVMELCPSGRHKLTNLTCE
jgi:serine/threonine protein kinase